MKGLTEEEETILQLTVMIWNTFTEMEKTHPHDEIDLSNAIHDIQKIISIRLARRNIPETFITIKQ